MLHVNGLSENVPPISGDGRPQNIQELVHSVEMLSAQCTKEKLPNSIADKGWIQRIECLNLDILRGRQMCPD
jgi:hypothetical protein